MWSGKGGSQTEEEREGCWSSGVKTAEVGRVFHEFASCWKNGDGSVVCCLLAVTPLVECTD